MNKKEIKKPLCPTCMERSLVGKGPCRRHSISISSATVEEGKMDMARSEQYTILCPHFLGTGQVTITDSTGQVNKTPL